MTQRFTTPTDTTPRCGSRRTLKLHTRTTQFTSDGSLARASLLSCTISPVMSRTVAVLLVLSTLCLQAKAFSSIVAFGDSLTDDCTMGVSQLVKEALDTDQPYPGVPYYNGCIFSNGPPYPVVAAGILDMSLTDYAKGGATSGAVPAVAVVPAGLANNSMPVSIEIPSTMEQVLEHLDTVNGTASPDAIYIVFIGANDYLAVLRGANATVEEVLEATAEAMDMLYHAGARVFYTQLLPLLGNTPSVRAAGPAVMAAANQLTSAHNAGLAQLLTAFAADHLEASVILFNFEALFLQLSQNAASLGITDLTTPCYTAAVAGSATTLGNASAVCDDPDAHLFWDGVHPTARSHQLWGQAVAAQLMPFASTTSSASRKLLADKVGREGLPLGSITIFGQPL